MSRIYTSADQLIGGTPLLELTHLEQAEGLQARVLGKLEYFNPAGLKYSSFPSTRACSPSACSRWVSSKSGVPPIS